MLRWISGFIVAAAVIAILFFVPKIGVQWIVVLISMLCLSEFFNATQKGVSLVVRLIGLLMGGFVTATLIFWADTPDCFLGLFAGALILSFLLHFRGNPDFSIRLKNTALFLFGILYVNVLCAYWGWIRAWEMWRFWVFLMLLCTVMSDIGGYVFGHWIGKHKLAPHLSPGKTIEGFIGGLIFAVAGAFLIRQLFWPDYPVGSLIIIALLIGIVGPLGDLSESLVKRGAGVKDSGNLIPGHGGFLDRVDALLFTGPVVYYFGKYFS